MPDILVVTRTESTGDPYTPPDLDLDGEAVLLATSVWEGATCALLVDGTLRCWGLNLFGALGYGHKNTIGDDETPASAGPVPF